MKQYFTSMRKNIIDLKRFCRMKCILSTFLKILITFGDSKSVFFRTFVEFILCYSAKSKSLLVLHL